MTIEELIARGRERNASDLHLICGLPPQYRIAGQLTPAGEQPLTAEMCETLARQAVGGRLEEAVRTGELDTAATIAGVRVRINVFRQQEVLSLAVRLLAETIPPLESLGLPPAVIGLTDCARGIILVTGETGSGKSTTLAAMIDYINHRRSGHVLTLEEYVDLVIHCLEVARPDLVIHRLTGDGPKDLLIAPLWSQAKRQVLNTIQKELKSRDTYQGRLYTPGPGLIS